MVIRCSQQVLKVIGGRSHSLATADPDPDDIYVSMFLAERKKCLVAMHAETLLSVTLLDVRVAQFRHLAGLLGAEFERLLGDMVLPTDLVTVPPGAALATTAGRGPLGELQAIESAVVDHLADRPLDQCDVRALNVQMQQMQHSGGGATGDPRSRVMARWERQLMSG